VRRIFKKEDDMTKQTIQKKINKAKLSRQVLRAWLPCGNCGKPAVFEGDYKYKEFIFSHHAANCRDFEEYKTESDFETAVLANSDSIDEVEITREV